jgi:hypothetical protein
MSRPVPLTPSELEDKGYNDGLYHRSSSMPENEDYMKGYNTGSNDVATRAIMRRSGQW